MTSSHFVNKEPPITIESLKKGKMNFFKEVSFVGLNSFLIELSLLKNETLLKIFNNKKKYIV